MITASFEIIVDYAEMSCLVLIVFHPIVSYAIENVNTVDNVPAKTIVSTIIVHTDAPVDSVIGSTEVNSVTKYFDHVVLSKFGFTSVVTVIEIVANEIIIKPHA